MCVFSDKWVTSGRKFQKKNHFWKINEKVIFWENSSEKHFFWKIQGEISHFFQKISWKTCFFCLENASKKESRESLAKVWRKFHWNFFSKKWEIALAPWILSKKMFSLEFSSKNDFFLDLSKRCFLFYWNFLPEVN